MAACFTPKSHVIAHKKTFLQYSVVYCTKAVTEMDVQLGHLESGAAAAVCRSSSQGGSFRAQVGKWREISHTQPLTHT